MSRAGIKNAFFPDVWLDSAYTVPYEEYYRKGIRGVIFDIDNTLVPHGAPADKRAEELFASIRELGMTTCLLSNNKEARVAPFARQVGSEAVWKAGKPKASACRKAMQKMGTTEETTIFVGDQIFTDIWCARLAGITPVLVKPIHPREEIQIVLKRIPEKLILFLYRRNRRKRRPDALQGRRALKREESKAEKQEENS